MDSILICIYIHFGSYHFGSSSFGISRGANFREGSGGLPGSGGELNRNLYYSRIQSLGSMVPVCLRSALAFLQAALCVLSFGAAAAELSTADDLHAQYYEIFKSSNRNAASFLWSSYILDRSTAQVTAAQAAVHALGLDGAFTVIHVGGIQSVADMQRSRATGAELRQWYTGLMHGLAQPEPLSLYARVTATGNADK